MSASGIVSDLLSKLEISSIVGLSCPAIFPKKLSYLTLLDKHLLEFYLFFDETERTYFTLVDLNISSQWCMLSNNSSRKAVKANDTLTPTQHWYPWFPHLSFCASELYSHVIKYWILVVKPGNMCLKFTKFMSSKYP